MSTSARSSTALPNPMSTTVEPARIPSFDNISIINYPVSSKGDPPNSDTPDNATSLSWRVPLDFWNPPWNTLFVSAIILAEPSLQTLLLAHDSYVDDWEADQS